MRRLRAIAVCCLLLPLAGCERGFHDMYAQPRLNPNSTSALFADGRSARVPPPGTLPYAGRLDGAASRLTADPGQRPLTAQLLARGRQRFDIDCSPCHARTGDGDGMVVQRGFPAPPSFDSERVRALSDQEIYQVITDGYGVMYPYADRVAPSDRRAIVAYIRALQLSRRVSADRLNEYDRAQLDSPVTPAAATPAP